MLMGTIWRVQIVVSHGEQQKAEKAVEHLFQELNRIEALMSEFRPDSPVSRLNQAAGTGPQAVPPELADLIRRGLDYGDLTRGAFDITWLALRGIWRFDDRFRPPSPEEVEQALSFVDYRRVELDGTRISLPPGYAVGLGGIAKGYAIDRAAAVLREHGFSHFLVEGGGDIFASGRKGSRAWLVGVRDPRGGPSDLVARLSIEDVAVVTSGDYERYRIVNGVRYHHIIDPRTGWPADGCRSVTILAKTAEQADALATGVFVLGPQEGLQLVERLAGVEAFIIDQQGEFLFSNGFLRYVVGKPTETVLPPTID